ncbi:Uncharacterized protein (Fragment) [Durusdinium trenchii]|uniref:Uncharacterized protein n=1 Tax=Durusdinium trenchii TaxID=1381693 RepID=A0ABP0IDS4_9DINO
MLFGEPGVDPRIQPLHRFPDEWDLPWASTYHSALETEVLHGSRIVLALRFAPDPYHCWAPDAELHAYAFVVPGLRCTENAIPAPIGNSWCHLSEVKTELKKLIRKELRISTAVISDSDVENLAAALDGDRTGSLITLNTPRKNQRTRKVSMAWFQSNGKTTAAPEEKAVPKILNILKE